MQEKNKTTIAAAATTEVYYKDKGAANTNTLVQFSFPPLGGALNETIAPYQELTLKEAALMRRINLSVSEETPGQGLLLNLQL